MKKRSLLFCTLLIITALTGKFLMAGDVKDRIKNVADNNNSPTYESYLQGLRANQSTNIVNPADVVNAADGVKALSAGRSVDPLNWTSLGPDNFGGKTTAILYDNRDATGRTIFAGSVGGGVWKSVNDGITWKSVSDLSLMVSCMVQASNGDLYVGTGDGFNAHTYTGLNDLGYTSGFVGTGMYKSTDGQNFDPIASTVPVANSNIVDWAFISKIALNDNAIYAATNTGLKYSADGGSTWSTAKDIDSNELSLNATDVEMGTSGIVVASVNNNCYISKTGSLDGFVNRSTGDSISLPIADVMRTEIALAPSDNNILYASCTNSTGTHIGIYRSVDQGDNWSVILPSTFWVYIYGTRGNYNNTITVFPDDADRILVGGNNLWQGKKIVEGGLFSWDLKSRNFIVNDEIEKYLHLGQQTICFKPGNSNIFFAGTDGGIFKGTISGDDFAFESSNRNYITTQFYTVAPTGQENRVLGGAQDQGTIYISGTGNTTTQGKELWFGDFSIENMVHGGSCVVSTIQPQAIVMSATAGKMERSEDLAFTLSTQFLGGSMGNAQAFKTPIALWESYEDQNSRDSVTYYAKKAYTSGSVLKVKSNNNRHPFYYTLPTNVSLAAGDSIRVKDIVATKLFIAVANRLWMTKEFLNFGKTPEWFELANTSVGYSGIPQSIAYSSDANHVFVGMRNGKLYRVSNIGLAYDYNHADVSSPQCIVATKEIPLVIPGTSTPVTQAITSIAVDPQNPNNVLLTLGNYGNDHYVLMSTNALDETPLFVSKQGNLPKMPVYASIIEMNHSNVVVLGTEQGVFVTDNISGDPSWESNQTGIGNVPVFDLKQQLINRASDSVQTINHVVLPNGDIVTDTTELFYPGTNNYGIIYGATYGKGLFRCNQYRKPVGINENPIVTPNKQLSISVYPNPVNSTAHVNYELTKTSNVSYSIYDLTGKMILQTNVGLRSAGKNQMDISVDELKQGYYILKIESSENSGVVKFLVY
jgi:hypothetical protein